MTKQKPQFSMIMSEYVAKRRVAPVSTITVSIVRTIAAGEVLDFSKEEPIPSGVTLLFYNGQLLAEGPDESEGDYYRTKDTGDIVTNRSLAVLPLDPHTPYTMRLIVFEGKEDVE